MTSFVDIFSESSKCEAIFIKLYICITKYHSAANYLSFRSFSKFLLKFTKFIKHYESIIQDSKQVYVHKYFDYDAVILLNILDNFW